MKKELEEQLYAKYPRLYRQKDLPMFQTVMCWGFACYDGWFALIDGLSAQLEELNERIAGEGAIEVAQVKEKSGYLRVHAHYVGSVPDSIRTQVRMIIKVAQEQSNLTCEYCGQPVMVREAEWNRTSCEVCEKSGSGGNSLIQS